MIYLSREPALTTLACSSKEEDDSEEDPSKNFRAAEVSLASLNWFPSWIDCSMKSRRRFWSSRVRAICTNNWNIDCKLLLSILVWVRSIEKKSLSFVRFERLREIFKFTFDQKNTIVNSQTILLTLYSFASRAFRPLQCD